MRLPLAWTCDQALARLKVQQPAGARAVAARIEVANEHGEIVESAVGSGTTVSGAIEAAQRHLMARIPAGAL